MLVHRAKDECDESGMPLGLFVDRRNWEEELARHPSKWKRSGGGGRQSQAILGAAVHR
jgi:hypothetical protein